MHNAALRLAISKHTRDHAKQINPWLPEIQVLPLALEERAVGDDIDQPLLDRLGEKSILIVGRLASDERYKGHDELIQIMPEVLQQCPDAQLVIAGTGDDVARLKASAQALGVGNSVIFAGFVSDVMLHALYQQCRVFAMPSKGEGFGLVYLEAMKASKPCLALCDTAAAEVIADGETGLLVNAGDLKGLQEALTRLLTDDTLATQLGEAGRERLETHFSVDAFNSRFHLSLTRLLEKS
jgi:phosphatidylinositol alpha-1,6-mannosyltransferase